MRSSTEPIFPISMEPSAPRFKIIDETADYTVVDKPAFLLAHPTKPDRRTTLWKQLRDLLAFEIANGGQVSIVNRLDRETSGLVLAAKTAAAARRVGLLMPERRLDQEYLANGLGVPKLERQLLLPRHALHSAKLAVHREHEWMSELPPDLAAFI